MSKNLPGDTYQRSELRGGRPADTDTEGQTGMDTSARTSKSLLLFFLLVFLFSVPLWGIGFVINGFLRDMPFYTVINLLWHISIAFIPMIVALILVRRERGSEGVKHLLKRPLDFARIKSKIWYLPILLLYPFLMVLEYGVQQLMGRALPDLPWPGLMVPLMFVVFLAAGIGEELGWSGYALDPLQQRWTALGASMILGVVSVVWHLVPIMQEPHTPMWIVWHSAQMIPLRIIMVWIYNNTAKSMFAVVAFHASVNIGEVVWPFYGISGDYDPFLATILMTITAVIVLFLWGSRTLARYRYA